MDEMDHVQDAGLAAMDAILAKRLRAADLLSGIKPPPERECDDCGCDIPTARLQAVPTARFCVDCQSDVERGPR